MIIATDNDIDSWKNYGSTFTSFYLKGANDIYHYAKKLSLNVMDGFITGNNANSQNKLLYDFYYNKIDDIKQFFIRNQAKIDKINKTIDVEICIKEIAEDIDYYNEKYNNENMIDREPISQITTTRQTTNTIIDSANNAEII